MNRKQQFRINSKRSRLTSIINNNGGKFFTVKFHKVDGSIRKMTCRAGVKNILKVVICHTVQRISPILESFMMLNQKAIALLTWIKFFISRLEVMKLKAGLPTK